MKLMRYNNYEEDPIENGNPGWAIMSRYDLGFPAEAFGGVDTKVRIPLYLFSWLVVYMCGVDTNKKCFLVNIILRTYKSINYLPKAFQLLANKTKS